MSTPPSPKFDPSFNLGHVLMLVGFLVTAAGQWYLTDYRLSKVEEQIKGLSTVVIEYARVDERIKAQDQRIDRLERR